ncbi:MAG: amylo-alpha-1,6-glucosidase [Acidobacteriota bacterium]
MTAPTLAPVPSSGPVRRLSFDTGGPVRPDYSLEWLVGNGLGGFASGPVAGGLTRRYHGLLIAALPGPLGRMLYLTHLRVVVEIAGRQILVDHEDITVLDGRDVARLREFRLESGLPVWVYAADGFVLEKRVVMPFGENTTYVSFRLLEATAPARLRIAPLMHVRPHDDTVSAAPATPPQLTIEGPTIEMNFPATWPNLRLMIAGPGVTCAFDAPEDVAVEYSVERARGYDFAGSLWMPGWIEMPLEIDQEVALVASTEEWDRLSSRTCADARAHEMARRAQLIVRGAAAAGSLAGAKAPTDSIGGAKAPTDSIGGAKAPTDSIEAELTIAADAFLITPVGRPHEMARAKAAGQEPRTVIAGYHWFTDWGRDTMISLEGLTLDTGRGVDAKRILLTFAHYIRDGLIPNLFPEGEQRGLYHTADATLWFFHAIHRYVERTGDHTLVAELLSPLTEIIEKHFSGTHFNIGVDAADGLLVQGAEGYQLTWMDAKMGDWVVTPRRGKAVEINALWYNALRLMSGWLASAGRHEFAKRYEKAADRVKVSFNARFWSEPSCHLYDVIDTKDGDDPACRPNQVLAISLPHPVLDEARWATVLEVVERTLLTPVGLRSLAPGHPEFQSRYFGNLEARDGAYHQGTVWAWLIGPFVDAWLKVHPNDPAQARRFLDGFVPHLDAACVGSISEVFDAEPPFTPRGCVAQAWSVAEVLRVWRKTATRPS